MGPQTDPARASPPASRATFDAETRPASTAIGADRKHKRAVTTDHFSSCSPDPILLCMGLFSRFCVWAPRCTAEEALRCVRDARSLVLRAHGESIQLQCIMR